MRVVLSKTERWQAAIVGVQRQIENLGVRRDAYGASDNGWDLHVEGAAGELAAAIATARKWVGKGTLRGEDIEGAQVRTSRRANGDLILHPRDEDGAIYILVTGRTPTFDVHGWIYARDGKRPEFWKDPAGGRPAFFVPQAVLRPLDTLPDVEGVEHGR